MRPQLLLPVELLDESYVSAEDPDDPNLEELVAELKAPVDDWCHENLAHRIECFPTLKGLAISFGSDADMLLFKMRWW